MNSDRATELTQAEPGHPKQNESRVPEHVRTIHGADGAIALDILHGQMFQLNFVGSKILELLQQGLTEPEIGEQLACEFGIERVPAEVDVRDFVEMLEKHHLLIAHNRNSLT